MTYSPKAIVSGIFAGTVITNPVSGTLERFTNAFIDSLDVDIFTKAALQLDCCAKNALAEFAPEDQKPIIDAINATI